jgi:hypothetical protein
MGNVDFAVGGVLRLSMVIAARVHLGSRWDRDGTEMAVRFVIASPNGPWSRRELDKRYFAPSFPRPEFPNNKAGIVASNDMMAMARKVSLNPSVLAWARIDWDR